MKREILRGHGIQGMRIDLSIMDMFAASQVADELKETVENHKRCEEYKKTPYDKRKELFPDGAPAHIELSEKTLQKLLTLMEKISFKNKSTLFEEESGEDELEQLLRAVESRRTLFKEDDEEAAQPF